MSKDTIEFFRELKGSRPNLTVQQYRTIKGQAVKGNIADARKGLHKVLKKEECQMNTTSEMQLVQIDKLIPYINNARTHSPEQLNKLRSSLREFGFINPVIIDRDFNVIAGHGRILAAKAENISEVPCVFVDYLTPAQKKAYIIADNRMALDAGWDEEMLKVEIEALQADDFDLGLTGFDEKELAAFLTRIPIPRTMILMLTQRWKSLA